MAKAQMFARRSRDVEALCLRKVCAIAIGRGDAELHQLPLLNGVSMQVEIFEGNARNQGHGWFVAQRLLDDIVQEGWVRLQLGRLARVCKERSNSGMA
jgi:hypothetical protein